MLILYNTLTNRKEKFIPINEGQIKMYVCGPTVYNEIHVGNARTAIVFDLLFRILKKLYKNVVYVRNITDIDDKIIKKAFEEEKKSSEVAKYWEESFLQNCKLLNILQPTHEPKATETIKEIIEFIQGLIEEGFAYFEEGSIFFKVDELAEYGSLSNNEELIEAKRIGANKAKRNQHDFILWKPSKLNEPYWNSPWGKGRPGWHIECSAMSLKFLGEKFDIHAGGQDLIFPHHENEQAQNFGLNGNFAGPRYWVHNAMLLMDGQKMSKSLGNIIKISEATLKYHPIFIRFFILSSHYRHVLNWGEENIAQIANRFDRWIFHLQDYVANNEILDELLEPLLDDLNFPEFCARFDKILEKALANKDKDLLQNLASSLNFVGCSPKMELIENEKLQEKLKRREEFKKEKNYKMADELRDEIEVSGYFVIDKTSGSMLKKKFCSILPRAAE